MKREEKIFDRDSMRIEINDGPKEIRFKINKGCGYDEDLNLESDFMLMTFNCQTGLTTNIENVTLIDYEDERWLRVNDAIAPVDNLIITLPFPYPYIDLKPQNATPFSLSNFSKLCDNHNKGIEGKILLHSDVSAHDMELQFIKKEYTLIYILVTPKKRKSYTEYVITTKDVKDGLVAMKLNPLTIDISEMNEKFSLFTQFVKKPIKLTIESIPVEIN